MQNLAQFRMTSTFGGEYLRNGLRYSKSVKYLIDSDSSHVRPRRNKSGELWSSNFRDLDVKLYPLKVPFLEDHILALRGCCIPIFLHLLENDQVLLAQAPHRGWPPLQFFSKGVKNWLKIQRISLKIFKAKGCSLMKLCHVMFRYVGVITPIQLLWGHHPFKIWEDKNRLKLGSISDNF